MKRSRAVLTALLLTSFLPLAAEAGGAFLFKLGSMQLRDDSQILGFQERSLDSGSEAAYGALLEHRFQKSGIGIGVEYAFYRHKYSPPSNPTGTAETRAIMLSARKYFLKEGGIHPFVGFGVGIGRTNVDHSGIPSFTDEELTTPFQAVVGVEFRADHLSFLVEAKHMYHDIESGGNEYNPTATGIFAGFGFNW